MFCFFNPGHTARRIHHAELTEGDVAGCTNKVGSLKDNFVVVG